MPRLQEHIDAGPIADWLNRRLGEYERHEEAAVRAGYQPESAIDRIVRELGLSHSGGPKLIYCWRRGLRTQTVDGEPQLIETETQPREWIERALEHFQPGLFFEVYPELEPAELEPEPGRPAVDARGRDLSKPRGTPPRITDAQVYAAHKLHIEGGLSLRELGRRGWEAWGYSSPRCAANQLSVQFKRLGLPARDRIEATVKASYKHGKLPRDPAKRDPALIREQKVKRGDVRDVRCKGIKTTSPGKGRPCPRFALKGSDYCLGHDPERREGVLRRLAEARTNSPICKSIPA